MDISLLSTSTAPEQLRTLAIAIVQKVMAENAELQNRIRIQEEQMKLARQQCFDKKCESLAGMQYSPFEEDVDTDIAEIPAHLDKLLSQTGDEEKTATRPVRKPLPSHLPRVEKVIPPVESRCPECDKPLYCIRNEVSEKMEYIPAQVVFNRYIRPQYSCPCISSSTFSLEWVCSSPSVQWRIWLVSPGLHWPRRRNYYAMSF